MTALAYEPFVLPVPPLETYLARVPSDSHLATHLAEWKAMRRNGWDLTALVAPDAKTVVALGCRGGS